MTVLLRASLNLLKRRNRNGILVPEGFDFSFYREYYSDLSHFKTDEALAQHYSVYGQKEGRFRNLAEATASFELRFGRLPSDFSPTSYRLLNDDLSLLYRNDWQYAFHYLEHGRNEGRPYRLEGGGDLSSRPWTNLFRLADFIACAHEWLEYPPQTWVEGIEVFERRGIDKLAPISLDCIFDPDFYRSVSGLERSLGDVELYRHWLNVGILADFSPNEERALRNWMPDHQFPACFRWKEYQRVISTRRPLRHRIDALSDLFERGFLETGGKYVVGQGANRLYSAIGDYHLVRGNHRSALAAYNLALAEGDLSSTVLHRRGDVHLALGNLAPAHFDFVRAAASPASSVWSHLHAARTAAETGSFATAFDILIRARAKWIKSGVYRETVRELIEKYFAQKTQAAMALYESEERVSADRLMIQTLDEIKAYIEELEAFPPAINGPTGHISILANQDIQQCNHYRVEQKIRQLKWAGISAEVFNQNNSDEFVTSLVGARAAIFYRVPAFPTIIRAILVAKALGIPTYYELDDLLFDPKFYPDKFETYEHQVSWKEYSGLCYGVPLFRYAMSLCDYGIASTEPLKRKMEKIVQRGECVLLRNGLDERNNHVAWLGQYGSSAWEVVTIFYGSGTKAHNSDFNELVAPALLEALEKHDNVQLAIVGHLALRPEFDRFAQRVRRIPFVQNIDQYWRLLSAADINLAVLSSGEMADCKSEIKWLEAAFLGVPSIVSATTNYTDVVEDGVDALIVRDASQWSEALRRLIVDPFFRRNVAASAYAKALRHYSLEAAAAKLKLVFGAGAPGNAVSSDPGQLRARRNPARLKVLICHVFFPPQTYGGATRVVQDNVDFIKRECPDIELSVFTTDEGASVPGRLSYDEYCGIPVFRLSTPLERNMDWRPFNSANEKVFERVLDSVEPDLIHFHCIQRLTASIVEVAVRRKIPYLISLHDGWWISDQQFFVDDHGVFRSPSSNVWSAYPPSGVALSEAIIRRERLSRLLGNATSVVAVSDTFANIYRRAGCSDVIAIPNGVSALEPVVRSRRGDGRLSLGHIGGRSAHKGATLVEAVLRTTKFRHLKLTMVDMTMEPNAQREVLWGTTPVTLRGPCPQHEVSKLYGSIDVLLAPSIWPESFGLVAREAIALGVWVVASDRGAMGEAIKNGQNGFVIDPSDGRSLTDVLHMLDADVKRFSSSPPFDPQPLRTAADQGRELVELYRKVVFGSSLEGKERSKVVAQ